MCPFFTVLHQCAMTVISYLLGDEKNAPLSNLLIYGHDGPRNFVDEIKFPQMEFGRCLTFGLMYCTIQLFYAYIMTTVKSRTYETG